MKFILRLSLLLLFCFPFAALAEIPEQLKNDFAPVSGSIIMPIGEEYLVDMDASNGLHEGDILTLLMAGEKIIQPTTKKVLGTIQRPKGFLQVTHVKSGYSYVKPLTPGIAPNKGDHVKRFEQVPAQFTSTQQAAKLAAELKAALPHLNWIENGDSREPHIIFHLEENTLKVTDWGGKDLASYHYTNGKLSGSIPRSYQPDVFRSGEEPQSNKSFLNQAVSSVTGVIGFGGQDKRLENPGITQSQQLDAGIWISPTLEGTPVGVAVADLDGDGTLETAVAMKNHLEILRIKQGKLKSVAVVPVAAGIALLSLDVADIDENGIPELYLTGHVGTKLSSQVVEFKNGNYQKTQRAIPWFFRSMTLPKEGKILIGELMDESENPFARAPFRVLLADGKLTKGPELPLPDTMNLFSFSPFQGSNNDLLYATISTDDTLRVTTPGGTNIWESSGYFGGTETYFFNKQETNAEMAQPVFIQKRLLTLPTGEVLAAKNEGIRIFSRYRSFNKSHLVALKWEGSALHESWATREQEGYLSDFTVADADNDGQDELVMVVIFDKNKLLQKGRPSIIIYELEQE